MKRPRILSIAGAIAFAAALVPGPAPAADFPGLPSAAAPVDDASLAGIRGKFVPPSQARVSASAVLGASSPQRAAEPLTYQSGSAVRSPLADLNQNNGTIAYFGVTMTSSWTVTNGGVTQGVQVGATLNVDVQNHSVSVGSWSQSQNGGLPSAPPTGNSVTGDAPASNISSGVGQSIQVAGNGNVISNQATVQYGSGPYAATTVPTTSDCTACTFQIGPNGMGIAIATPQGNASQSIGAGGILQAAQVWSDLNTITNQLGVNVQTARSSTPFSLPNATQIVPILPSISGIP